MTWYHVSVKCWSFFKTPLLLSWVKCKNTLWPALVGSTLLLLSVGAWTECPPIWTTSALWVWACVWVCVCVCTWVCACVWRGEWEGDSTREHSLLKMMWLISSVHKKENFVDLRKKKTKNKLRAKHNFYPPSQNLVFRSISQAVPFSSLHQNHAVWFPTLWNIIDLLEMKVHCKLRHTTLSPIGWMAGAGKPQLLEC